METIFLMTFIGNIFVKTLIGEITNKMSSTNTLKKIEMAVQYKEKGNERFKLGQFKKAIVSYSTALSYTKGLPGRKIEFEGMSKLAADNTKTNENYKRKL